jgi:WD40 repeat protein
MLLILCCLVIHGSAFGSLKFSNRWSSFLLTDTSSKIQFTPSVIYGHKGRSVNKFVSGSGDGDYNILNYTVDDNIITYQEAPEDVIGSLNVYTTNYLLSPGEIINGFAQFNAGFTVPTFGGAIVDTNLTVSGGFDLQTTGSLVLRGNIHLDGNSIIHNGGTIYGYNAGLILDGSLTLTAGKTLHISGETFIDGNNHELIVDDNAQIFVDNNATLTLRNVIIRNGQHTTTKPPVKLASPLSKLALDNVVMSPMNDFLFPQGQLFIHNDVKFTGTSAFVYQSPVQSWIASGGRWTFDIGTTFSVAPVTFTTAPLDQTFFDRDFIKMSDKSSTLYLNGCSLVTTHTGLRLTTGTLLFDNAVKVFSAGTTKLLGFGTGIEAGTSIASSSLSWSPDGRFLACAVYGGTSSVYPFDGSSFGTPINIGYGIFSTSVPSIAWSPDGRYLAVGGDWVDAGTPRRVCIYQFNGTAFTRINDAYYNDSVYSVAWSPDGQYLAVGGIWYDGVNAQYARVYRFDGTYITYVANTGYGSTNNSFEAHSVAWSPDGKYLAVGGTYSTGSEYAMVYPFDGNNFGAGINTSHLYSVNSVAWSPDGRHLAVGGITTSFGSIYPFTGTTFGSGINTTYAAEAKSVTWSPDGRYITVGGSDSTDSLYVKTYYFDGSACAPIASVLPGQTTTVAWSYDGKHLATSNASNTYAYPSLFIAENAIQAMSNSLIFGNSAQGAQHDLDVTLLSGAIVDVVGNINYDGVN